MFKYKLIGYILLVLLSSCGLPRYTKKSEKVIKGSYSMDSLRMSNYVFYHNVTNSWGVVQDFTHNFDQDSVLRILKGSLDRLPLNVKFDTVITNFMGDSFHVNWRRPFTKDIEQTIIFSTNNKNELQLVPLIKIESNYQSGMYFTSSGGVGGSRYVMREKIILIFYIIENNSIVYARSALSLSPTYPAYDMRETMHLLTQKDWDELVALVMKDYVERIR
jgi:hypothetical protein